MGFDLPPNLLLLDAAIGNCVVLLPIDRQIWQDGVRCDICDIYDFYVLAI